MGTHSNIPHPGNKYFKNWYEYCQMQLKVNVMGIDIKIFMEGLYRITGDEH